MPDHPATSRIASMRLNYPRLVLAAFVGVVGAAAWFCTSHLLMARSAPGVVDLIAGCWFAAAWILASMIVRLRGSLVGAAVYAVLFPYATIAAAVFTLWALPAIIALSW